jgi:hypothetical protein
LGEVKGVVKNRAALLEGPAENEYMGDVGGKSKANMAGSIE